MSRLGAYSLCEYWFEVDDCLSSVWPMHNICRHRSIQKTVQSAYVELRVFDQKKFETDVHRIGNPSLRRWSTFQWGRLRNKWHGLRRIAQIGVSLIRDIRWDEIFCTKQIQIEWRFELVLQCEAKIIICCETKNRMSDASKVITRNKNIGWRCFSGFPLPIHIARFMENRWHCFYRSQQIERSAWPCSQIFYWGSILSLSGHHFKRPSSTRTHSRTLTLFECLHSRKWKIAKIL